MNEYLVRWLSENFPGMVQNGDDCLCELDYHDMNRFADWMQEQFSLTAVSCRREQLHKLLQNLSDEDELTYSRTHQQIIEDFEKLL